MTLEERERRIEAAARELLAVDDEGEQRHYDSDPAAFRLGRPKPSDFDEWRDEYVVKATRMINAADEVVPVVDEASYQALADYVAEAAGPESVLLPISMLHELVPRFSHVPREQLSRAVMNVMQLDVLRRCHEDRSDLKQQLRNLQNRYDELERDKLS